MSKRKALDDDLRWLFDIQISSNEDETMDKEVEKVLRRGILYYYIFFKSYFPITHIFN